MRFRAVATDYDGTIAHEGRVEPSLVGLLKAVRTSGRKLLLVTGRELPSLKDVFPRFAVFDLIVAENGALLYNPATNEKESLSDPIPATFIRELRQRRVAPLSLGHGIVATWRSFEDVVVETISDLGLDLQAIPNKDSIMVLPAGINKRTGLKAALSKLKLPASTVVGLGDAENDEDFLRFCGLSVAVANALKSVKRRADVVTQGEEGRGAAEILEALLADGLEEYLEDQALAPRRSL